MRLFDLHCDTLTEAMNAGLPLRENRLQLSFARGAAYRPWVQTMAVFVPDTLRGDAAWHYFCRAEAYLTAQLHENPEVRRVRSAEDLHALTQANAAGVMLAVEGGAVLGGRLERIAQLAEAGVRMLTLTWNGADELGGGADEPGGLTPFGRAALPELQKHGIVPDLSHASDALFWDVCASTNGPLVATHSNSRMVCGFRRNLTDAQFCAIARRGGLVGINLYPSFINGRSDASLDEIYAHIDRFCALGGERALALGTDFDGASMPAELPDIASLGRLWEYLLRKNMKESLVRGLFFDHAADFFCGL